MKTLLEYGRSCAYALGVFFLLGGLALVFWVVALVVDFYDWCLARYRRLRGRKEAHL